MAFKMIFEYLNGFSRGRRLGGMIRMSISISYQMKVKHETLNSKSNSINSRSTKIPCFSIIKLTFKRLFSFMFQILFLSLYDEMKWSRNMMLVFVCWSTCLKTITKIWLELQKKSSFICCFFCYSTRNAIKNICLKWLLSNVEMEAFFAVFA